MKGFFSTTTLLFASLAICPLNAAENNINVTYLEPQDQSDADAKSLIESSGVNDIFLELGAEHFQFNKPLKLQYGSEDGPLYDPEAHTVHMPYDFVTSSFNYFSKNDYEKNYDRTAQDGTVDILLHTLLHEAAHAYIADQSIPILGKEEDAADNFAAVLMLNYLEDGDTMTISAADLLAFESDDKPDYYQIDEYIGEHSFDLQRYFATLCLVYGSDPEKHASLLDEVEKEYRMERKDFCVYQFDVINANWHHYFSQ